MSDKYNPRDDSDLSMGDLNTVGGVPLSAKGNPVSPDDRSMGDLPTMTGGTPAARADERFEGKALSERYADLVEIGRGGFAVVYKARDKRLRREIVVKRLHFEQAGMDEGIIRRRFEHEAHAIAALNHPNIVQVYDYDRDAEGHYIVMEYVSGGSLKDLLKQKGKLEVKEAIAIIKAVCGGLAFAHRKNLVHRDIKPANILLAGSSKSEVLNPKECIPKIADFGLARSGFETGMSMSLSMSGTGMGTPYYMPPEQREDAKNVNHTADIYAVGKTLYQLVTGDIPDNVDPELIPTPELAKIIFKCVKTRPEDRYFSMEELIQALDGIGSTKHAKDKKIGHQQSAISNANACPTCGRACSDMELFCAECGKDLSKACPECAQKNSRFRRFCNGCGTDMEGFGLIVGIDAQVKTLAGEKDWAGVLAASNRLPKEVRVGAKGTALKKSIVDSKQLAQRNLKEVERLERTISEYASAVPLNADDGNGKEYSVCTLQDLRQLFEAFAALAELKPLSAAQEDVKRELLSLIVRMETEKANRKAVEEMAEQERLKKALLKEASPKKRKKALVAILMLSGLVAIGIGLRRTQAQRQRAEAQRIEAQRKAFEVPQTVAPLTPFHAIAPQAGKIWRAELGDGVSMEFMPIPAGSFQMGSTNGDDNEKPVHRVTLTKPFWMAKTEVTQAQWRQVMGSNPSNFKGDDLPVETVSWNDAMEFCRKLTERERQAGRLPAGFEYTLPTEAQWEYACRAGTTGDYAGNLDAMAWYTSNSGSKTHAVGTKQANAWGLYDMLGNVWEWCSDWYGNYASGIAIDPQGASTGSYRVSRGGCWNNSAGYCRLAYRFRINPTGRSNFLGFRPLLLQR